MKVFLRILVLLAACGGLPVTGHAGADSSVTEYLREPPMWFRHVRSKAPGCEPVCPEWIAAQGRIVPGTADKFAAFVNGEGMRQLPLILHAQGGDWDEAIALGREIRELKLNVGISFNDIEGCDEETGCVELPKEAGAVPGTASAMGGSYLACGSSCVLALAGGEKRVVGSWAKVGILQVTAAISRQFYNDLLSRGEIPRRKSATFKAIADQNIVENFETVPIAAEILDRIRIHLRDMGVEGDAIDKIRALEILEWPNNKQTNLVQHAELGELKKSNLVTSMDSADALISASLCKAENPPVNCIAR
jgi:hypothetical protein